LQILDDRDRRAPATGYLTDGFNRAAV